MISAIARAGVATAVVLLVSFAAAPSVAAPLTVSVTGADAEKLLGEPRATDLRTLQRASKVPVVLTVDAESKAVLLLRLDHAGATAAASDRPAATKAAMTFLRKYQRLLDPNVKTTEYTPAPDPHGCERASASFERRVGNLAVLGSHLTVWFSPEGRVIAVDNAMAPVPGKITKLSETAATSSQVLPGGYMLKELPGEKVLVPRISGQQRVLQEVMLVRWNDQPKTPAKGRILAALNGGAAGLIGPVVLRDLAPLPGVPLHHIDPATGLPDFITYRPVGGVKIEKVAAERNPGEIVYRFLQRHPTLFRTGAPRCQFRVKTITESPRLPDVQFVRMQQMYAGLPVFGAELVFEVHGGSTVMSIAGHVLGKPRERVVPTLTRSQAIARARTHAKAALNRWASATQATVVGKSLDQVTPIVALGIFPGDLLVRDKAPTTLAYRVAMSDYVYFIDARTGDEVYAHSSKADQDRIVTDAVGQTTYQRPTYVPVNLNGTGTAPPGMTPNADVAGVVASMTTLRTSLAALGWSGIDGSGKRFLANTAVAIGNACNPQNAQYDTELTDEAYFCLGVAPPDVVGHEFTHGVIAASSGLVYRDESGALNESYADIMGNLLFPDAAAAGAAPAWLLGEGVAPALAITGCRPLAAFRNMANPGAFCDAPNETGYFSRNGATPGGAAPCNVLPNSCDNGWVHANSGITNLAHVFLAQGIAAGGGVAAAPGTAGAVTPGITRPRLTTLAFMTMTRLSPWSRMIDAAMLTREMCDSLRTGGGTATDGSTFRQVDCDQVPIAFRQVGLSADLVGGWAEPEMGFSGTDRLFRNAGDVLTSGCNVTSVFEDMSTPSGDMRATFTVAGAVNTPVSYYGLFGVAVSTPPAPGGSPAKRHDVAWTSISGHKPAYTPGFVEAPFPAGAVSCIAPPGTWPVDRALAAVSHDADFGDKNDEFVGPAASTMAAGCVVTQTQVELVDGNNSVIAGPGGEVKQKVELGDIMGVKQYAERGARIRTAPPGAPNLRTEVHWWFETGTDVRYRVRYFITQPVGTDCQP